MSMYSWPNLVERIVRPWYYSELGSIQHAQFTFLKDDYTYGQKKRFTKISERGTVLSLFLNSSKEMAHLVNNQPGRRAERRIIDICLGFHAKLFIVLVQLPYLHQSKRYPYGQENGSPKERSA
jgi:hypothetical protein